MDRGLVPVEIRLHDDVNPLGLGLKRSAPSCGGFSTVDVEDMACDEPGLVRRDEYNAVSDFFRPAEPTERNLLRQKRLVLGRTCEAGQHAGVCGARRHGIRADTQFGGLKRHGSGETLDGVLGGDVDRGESRALVSVGRPFCGRRLPCGHRR